MTTTSARINVDQLNNELLAMRARFDQWSQGKLLALDQLKGHHLQQLRQSQATIGNLEARQTQLEHKAKEVKQRLEVEHHEIEVLRQQCEQFSTQEQQLPQHLNQLKKVLDEETQTLQEKETALAKECAAQQKKLDSLHHVVNLYRSRLGLTFVQPEDGSDDLELVLTHIDPHQPQRAFKFAVRVGEDDTYQVTKCVPPVDRLPELLHSLNETHSFCNFVRAMRNEFKSMVLPS